MFSINDAEDTGEEVEIQVKNYAEIGHTHEISEVNGLEERLKAIEAKLNSKNQALNILNDIEL